MLQVPKQSKYQPFSLCLQSLKELPLSIQDLFKSTQSQPESDLLNLQKLASCSNSFSRLNNKEHAKGTSNIQLYNRFFSRLRQLTYSLLASNFTQEKQRAKIKNPEIYYEEEKLKAFQITKQVLIRINKTSQKYQPESDPAPIFEQIRICILKKTIEMALFKGIRQDQLQIIETEKYSIGQKYGINSEIDDSFPLYLKNPIILQKKQSKTKVLEKVSLTKQLGLDVIVNIESSHLQRISSSSQNQLLRQSLNRNRYISNIIQKYENKFTAWNKKPSHKKNRMQNEYKPTVYVAPSPEKKKSEKKNLRINKFQSQNKTTTSLYKTVSNQITSQPPEQTLKEEIMDYIYAHREKYCLKKVIVLGNNLQVGPKDMVIAPRDTNAKSKDVKKKLEVKRSHSFRVESAKINRASENVKLSCHRRHSHRGYYKNSRGFESHNTVTLMNKNFL